MIAFPENIILENERVLLRPLEKTDIDFLIPFAINEPEIWQFSPTSMGGEEGLKKYIDETIGQRLEKKNTHLLFLINRQTAMREAQDFMTSN